MMRDSFEKRRADTFAAALRFIANATTEDGEPEPDPERLREMARHALSLVENARHR